MSLEKSEIVKAFVEFKKELSSFLPKEDVDDLISQFCIQSLYARGHNLLNTYFGHYNSSELVVLLKEADEAKKKKAKLRGRERRGQLRAFPGGARDTKDLDPSVQTGVSLELPREQSSN